MSATFTPEIFTQPFSKISRTSVYETMYEGVSKYFGVFPHNGGECVRVCVCVLASLSILLTCMLLSTHFLLL